MNWFTSWWEAMTGLQQVFSFMAIPATVILLIQIVMLLIGLGGEQDMDADGEIDDGSADGYEHDGLKLITVRGLVAFFAVGGWLGIAMIDAGLHPAVASLIALIGGFGALLLVAAILKWASRLQDDGNVNYDNAVGMTGEVYIAVPPNFTGKGKINVTVQNRYIEADAVSGHTEPLKHGAAVKIVGLSDPNTFLIKPL